MPSREAMRKKLETLYDTLPEDQFERVVDCVGGKAPDIWDSRKALDDPKSAIINRILADADASQKHKDSICRVLDLQTDAEEQAELNREAVSAAKTSAQAAKTSARAAHVAAVVAIVSLVVSIVALLKNSG